MNTRSRPTRLRFVALAAASVMVVATAAPASANWAYFNLGSCHTTIFNGSNYAQTSVTAPNVCNSKIVGIKVQYPGTSAYWTGWKSSALMMLPTYAPSGSYVIQSYHSIVDGAAQRYLNIS